MTDQEEAPLEPTPGEEAGEVVSLGLNAVPVAGGVLAGIADGIIRRRQNRRLNDFLRRLAEDLKSLEDRLNEEFMRTEEFQDLAEDLLSKAADTRQEEKLDALRSILVNTVISDAPSYDEAAEISDLVSGWRPRHVVLLRILSDPVAADDERGGVVGEGSRVGSTSISGILGKLLPEWGDGQIDRTWADLHDARIHNTSGTKAMMTDQGIHQLEGRLTPFGQKVAKFLRNPAPGR